MSEQGDADAVFVVDGNPLKFHVYSQAKLTDGALGVLLNDIHTHGGEILDEPSEEMNVILASEADMQYVKTMCSASSRDYMNYVHVEPLQFVKSCIRNGRIIWTKIVKKGMPGYIGGGRRRNEFTEEEDLHLCEYISKVCPDKGDGGRYGNNIYMRLEDIGQDGDDVHRYGDYGWIRRHTWQSWRERYKKNANAFDRVIAQMVAWNEQNGDRDALHAREDPRARGQNALVRRRWEAGQQDVRRIQELHQLQDREYTPRAGSIEVDDVQQRNARVSEERHAGDKRRRVEGPGEVNIRQGRDVRLRRSGTREGEEDIRSQRLEEEESSPRPNQYEGNIEGYESADNEVRSTPAAKKTQMMATPPTAANTQRVSRRPQVRAPPSSSQLQPPRDSQATLVPTQTQPRQPPARDLRPNPSPDPGSAPLQRRPTARNALRKQVSNAVGSRELQTVRTTARKTASRAMAPPPPPEAGPSQPRYFTRARSRQASVEPPQKSQGKAARKRAQSASHQLEPVSEASDNADMEMVEERDEAQEEDAVAAQLEDSGTYSVANDGDINREVLDEDDAAVDATFKAAQEDVDVPQEQDVYFAKEYQAAAERARGSEGTRLLISRGPRRGTTATPARSRYTASVGSRARLRQPSVAETTSDEGFPPPGTRARAKKDELEEQAKSSPFIPLPGTKAARAARAARRQR